MRLVVSLLVILAVSFPGTVVSSSWQDYVSAQDEEVVWANTVRGVIRGKSGMAALQRSAGETYDFQPLLQSLATVTDTKDLILPVGGLGSGRRQDLVDNYIRMIRFDNGERWRRLVLEQTTAVAARFLQRDVYWQIGNEINSWHYGATMSSWADSDETVIGDPLEDIHRMKWDDPDERTQRKEERKQSRNLLKKLKRNNSDVIPLYVEYFLAPTAQAIIEAREHKPEYGSRIKIILGTIANSHSARAQSWLDNLLNYRIRGEFAAQLAGRRVSDVVDIIALHYMVSSPGPEWRDALRSLYGGWLGSGSISGIWSTEEIGKKRATSNHGGAAAISVLSRYIDLWHELGVNPSQGRVNFWGWNLGDSGTRAGDAMHALMSLVGDTQLTPLPEGEVSLYSTGDFEPYFFKTTQGKLVLVQFTADKGRRSSFNGFQIKWGDEGEPRVRAIVFGAGGQAEIEAEVKVENGLLTVNTPAVLSTREVILVIVDHA